MELKIKRLNLGAMLPFYATSDAACFDLHSLDAFVLMPFELRAVRTGLAFEVPKGWRMDVYIRSGLALQGISLANGVGKIDADYRGEVKLLLRNETVSTITFYPGDRIAQAELNPVHRAVFVEVDELSETDRGEGGFGSTGV